MLFRYWQAATATTAATTTTATATTTAIATTTATLANQFQIKIVHFLRAIKLNAYLVPVIHF